MTLFRFAFLSSHFSLDVFDHCCILIYVYSPPPCLSFLFILICVVVLYLAFSQYSLFVTMY